MLIGHQIYGLPALVFLNQLQETRVVAEEVQEKATACPSEFWVASLDGRLKPLGLQGVVT